MKKINYGFLLLLATGSLSSCNNSKTADDKTGEKPMPINYNPFKEDFDGEVKEMTESTYTVSQESGSAEEKYLDYREYSRYDEKGNRVEWITLGGEGEEGNSDTTSGRRTVYQYDANGRWIGDSTFSTDGEFLDYSVMRYDDTARQLEYKLFTAAGDLTYKFIYSFNDKGWKTEEKGYGSNDSLLSKTTYVYDNSGKGIEDIAYSGKNELQSRITYTFDEKGNNIERKNYRADGSLESRTTVKYDADGNEIQSINFYSTQPSDSMVTTNSYIKSENKNWTRKSVFGADPGTSEKVVERKFVYY